MDNFSVFNYKNLPEAFKVNFNNALAQRLSFLLNDLKSDVILGSLPIEEFITSSGVKATNVVTELYPKITSGIQAGSGNQNLFNSVLYEYIECWDEINKK